MRYRPALLPLAPMLPARALLAAALLAAAPLLAGPARAACDLPLPDTSAVPPLPRVAAALRATPPQLDVLAVGSATVLGGHGRPAGGFPAAMAAALRAARPGLDVTLQVFGKRGEMASAMLPVLREQLAARRFALVLWQTGTMEAIRQVPPAEFAATVAEGARLVRAHGADLVLIDPLYSAALEARADLAPYRAVLAQAAAADAAADAATGAATGTALFDRFSLMQGWAASGALRLDQTPKPARHEAMARLDGCIGELLARQVLAGAAR